MNKIKNLNKTLKNIEPNKDWFNDTLVKLKNLENLNVTESQFNGKYKKNNLYFNSFFMPNKKLLLFAVGGGGAVLFSTLLIAGLFLFNGINNQKSQLTLLSKEDENNTIYNLIKNNKGSIVLAQNSSLDSGSALNNQQALTNSKNLSTENSNSALAQADTSTINNLMQVTQLFPDTINKLIISKIKNTTGNATCGTSVFDSSLYNNYNDISYYFYDSNGNYISKSYKEFGNNNVIADYYYNVNTSSTSESIEYMGGKYAVRNYSEFISSMPITPYIQTEPAVTENSDQNQDVNLIEEFKKIYGDTAKIYTGKAPNGEDAILVETSFKTYCNSALPIENQSDFSMPNFWDGEDYNYSTDFINSQGDTNLITRTWFNKNFETILSENYKNSVEEKNLINRSEFLEYKLQDASFESAKELVKFDLNVEVKDINQNASDSSVTEFDYEKEVNNTLNKLKSNNYPVFGFNLQKYTNAIYLQDSSNIVTTLPYFATHREDRNFYAPGELGDLLMNSYNQLAKMSVSALPAMIDGLKYNFSSYISDFTVEDSIIYSLDGKLYESRIDNIEIINSFLYSPVIEKSVSDISLNLNEQSATLYSYTVKENYLTTASIAQDGTVTYTESDCSNNSCTRKEFIIIANFNNNLKLAFKVNATQKVSGNVSDESLRPTNQVDLQYTNTLLQELSFKQFDLQNSVDFNEYKDSLLRGNTWSKDGQILL